MVGRASGELISLTQGATVGSWRTPSARAASIVNVVELQVQTLLEYRDVVAAASEQSLARMAKQAYGLPESECAEYWDHHYDELSLYRDEVPQVLGGAVLIQLYSVFERRFKQLCEVARQIKPGRKLKRKPGESNIGTTRRYLKRDLRLRILDGSEWRRIDRVRALRNCLVHDMGRVPRVPKKDLASAMRHVAGVTTDSTGYLTISAATTDQFADDMLNYIRRVAEGISS